MPVRWPGTVGEPHLPRSHHAAGHEGEVFGLYATTGRAVSFLAPVLFGLFISIFGAQYWGILGIVIVLLAGLVTLIPVKAQQSRK